MKRLITIHLVQLVSCFLIVLGIAWSYLNQPAHWDETAYIDGVRTIFTARGFPFVEFWSYKPPLHFEIGATMWALFGVGRWQLRLAAIAELTVLLYLFKLVTQEILRFYQGDAAQQSRWYWQVGAWLLMALLATNPVVAGQAFLYQPELLLVALWLLVIYLYIRGKWGWYWLAASLMLLVKESAVLNFGMILVVEVARGLFSKGEWLNKVKRLGVLASPMVWLLAWLLGNKLLLGWWLWPYNIEFFSATKPYDAPATMKLAGMFIDNQLWLTTLLALLSLVFSVTRLRQVDKSQDDNSLSTYLVLLMGAGVAHVLFALVGVFTPRYALSLYPALVAAVALGYGYLGQKLGNWRFVAPVVIGVVVILQASLLLNSAKTGRFDGWALDHDWRYMRTTQKYQELQAWWLEQYPQHLLIGDWLAWAYFIDPLYGYVAAPMPVEKFENCEQVIAQQQPFLLMTGIGLDAAENQTIVACATKLQLQPLAEFTPIVVYTAKDEE